MSTRRKQALGKGLGALLGTSTTPATLDDPNRPHHTSALSAALATPMITPATPEPAISTTLQAEDGELRYIRPADITPNPHQPRRKFDPESLDELADSIREHGILQPLVVTPGNRPGAWILLAGERRLRAAELARLEKVPVRILEATDQQRLEIAIIENVQRDNLNPVEEASAYQQLANSFDYSQDQIARRVGKSRVAIANSLRLLKLHENCLDDLREGRLTSGHARAILMLAHPLQQEEIRKEILQRKLSVREAESLARAWMEGRTSTSTHTPGKKKADDQQDLDVVALQEQLTLLLGCKVRLKARSKTKGALEIQYQNLDDLDRVLEKLGYEHDPT